MRFPVFCVELLIAELGTKVWASKSSRTKCTVSLEQKDSQSALKKQTDYMHTVQQSVQQYTGLSCFRYAATGQA